jgi:hypothetical protein
LAGFLPDVPVLKFSSSAASRIRVGSWATSPTHRHSN